MAKLTKKQQSAIGRRSRRKGKAFECWCARFFYKWFEGKWQSTRNSGRTDLKGDIYCVDYPLSDLVVECKHDKKYNVMSMLRPTEAFKHLIRKYRRRQVNIGWGCTLLLIVKNKAGVWLAVVSNKYNLNEVLVSRDVSAVVIEGVYFFKLEQSISQLKNIIRDIHVDAVEQMARDKDARSKGVGRTGRDG